MYVLDLCLPGSGFVPLIKSFIFSESEDLFTDLDFHFFEVPNPGFSLLYDFDHVEGVCNLRRLQNGACLGFGDL